MGTTDDYCTDENPVLIRFPVTSDTYYLLVETRLGGLFIDLLPVIVLVTSIFFGIQCQTKTGCSAVVVTY